MSHSGAGSGGRPLERRLEKTAEEGGLLHQGDSYPMMVTAWAEDKLPRQRDLSAVPGTKTEGGQHDATLSFTFGIGAYAILSTSECVFQEPRSSRPGFPYFTLNPYMITGRLDVAQPDNDVGQPVGSA